jgi:tetratricopeptide (TPR) repeat protein
VEDDPWREHLLQSCYNIQTLSLEFENYANAGQFAKALPLLDRVEALDPHNWIPDLLRGWSQAQAHHLDQAIASYRRALDKKGDKEKIVPIMAAALVEKGSDADALKLCAAASQELPDSMPILTAYENLVSKNNDPATDAELLKRMIAKEPFTYSTNLKLSKIYWSTGRYAEALPYLKQIADLYPSDVTSRALLGQYYVSTDQASIGVPYIEQALEQEKDGQIREQLRTLLGSAYFKAAAAFSSAGKYEQAGEVAEKAAGVLSNDVRLLSVAAENFAAAKNYRRAEAALQKLISLQPDNPTLYLSLGDLEAEEGESAQARQDWQMALARLPAGDTELRPELQSRLSRVGSTEGQKTKR